MASAGHFTEGRNWVYRLLAATSDDERVKDHATALTTAGVLAFLQSDYSPAESHFKEALVIRRRLGDRRHTAVLLQNLGSIALLSSPEAARPFYDEALSIARELGDRRDIGFLLHCIGIMTAAVGDYPAAQSMLEEGVSIRREFGRWGAAETLTELGTVRHLMSDQQSARTHLTEALAGEREFGNRQGVARALLWLGIVSHELGDLSAGRTQLCEALEILHAVSDRADIATALEAIGGLIGESSSSSDAARIWGCAQQLRNESGTRRMENEVERYQRLVAAARSSLADDVAFDRAWEEGQSLTLEEAVRLARSACTEPQ